jgi:hypothetical protein
MIDSPALTHFLSTLVTQKHGPHIAAEAHDQLVTELSPRLEKWLILKAMETLGDNNPDDLREFQNLAQGDTPPEKVLQFIQSHIPDTEVFFAKTMMDFGDLYLHPENANL